MGKRARRGQQTLRNKRLRLLVGCVAGAVLCMAIWAVYSLFVASDAKALRRAGIDFEECRRKNDVLTLCFAGDATGILSCRQALNVVRAETWPETVIWRTETSGEVFAEGRLDHASVQKRSNQVRIETLSEDLTLLKIRYELERCGLAAQVSFCPTVGAEGKTLRVRLDTSLDRLASAAVVFLPVLHEVNVEGGGIVRCDVEFYENDVLFACVSYDFLYGDVLRSSALQDILPDSLAANDSFLR